ncbi:hypothetical protein NMY22_g18886 [Coprinellus aureogranulatus]|nr:hypothetical protein NMY22_g18886 [Coprinellus aureogranulatus]
MSSASAAVGTTQEGYKSGRCYDLAGFTIDRLPLLVYFPNGLIPSFLPRRSALAGSVQRSHWAYCSQPLLVPPTTPATTAPPSRPTRSFPVVRPEVVGLNSPPPLSASTAVKPRPRPIQSQSQSQSQRDVNGRQQTNGASASTKKKGIPAWKAKNMFPSVPSGSTLTGFPARRRFQGLDFGTKSLRIARFALFGPPSSSLRPFPTLDVSLVSGLCRSRYVCFVDSLISVRGFVGFAATWIRFAATWIRLAATRVCWVADTRIGYRLRGLPGLLKLRLRRSVSTLFPVPEGIEEGYGVALECIVCHGEQTSETF